MRDLFPLVLLCLAGCARTGLAPAAPADAGAAPPPAAAQPPPDPVERAQALRAAGQGEQAGQLLDAAAAEAQRRRDGLLLARAVHKQGDLAMDEQRCDEAEALYLRAFNLHSAAGELARAGLAANDLGLWSEGCDSGIYAREWYRIALDLRRQAKDLKGVRVSAANVGRDALVSRQYEEADAHFTLSLEAARKLGDAEGERKALMNLALTWAMAATQDSEPLVVKDAAAAQKARAFFAQGVEAARRTTTPDGDQCTWRGELCPLILGADAGR